MHNSFRMVTSSNPHTDIPCDCFWLVWSLFFSLQQLWTFPDLGLWAFRYVAPEYAMTGHLLVSSDVYSYGVVLLELLTGRRPVYYSSSREPENLVRWACPLLATREGVVQSHGCICLKGHSWAKLLRPWSWYKARKRCLLAGSMTTEEIWKLRAAGGARLRCRCRPTGMALSLCHHGVQQFRPDGSIAEDTTKDLPL